MDSTTPSARSILEPVDAVDVAAVDWVTTAHEVDQGLVVRIDQYDTIEDARAARRRE